MKLWLDDVRVPPDESWTWVKTVEEAIALMDTGDVTEASLDHDLGTDQQGQELPEGRTLVYWMAENGCWPSDAITIHSANVVGVDYMVGMIERYSSFMRVGHSTRFGRSAPASDQPSS
jgi:hypothetical protein